MMKITYISDTHGNHNKIDLKLLEGADVLIHAGDFTNFGIYASLGNSFPEAEVMAFNDWLGEIDIPNKLVICGNHELGLDYISKTEISNRLLTNCQYLDQQSVTINNIKFWAEPRTPQIGNWAFGLPRDTMKSYCWDNVPSDTDVLITHGPPFKISDAVRGVHGSINVGCVYQSKMIYEHPTLKYVICGHIHEGYGEYHFPKSNGEICKILNVSFVNEKNKLTNRKPKVIYL